MRIARLSADENSKELFVFTIREETITCEATNHKIIAIQFIREAHKVISTF